MRDGCHTGSVRVCRVLDVRHDFAPSAQVGAGLVDEALAVGGVEALVRIVDNDLVVIVPEVGLKG